MYKKKNKSGKKTREESYIVLKTNKKTKFSTSLIVKK